MVMVLNVFEGYLVKEFPYTCLQEISGFKPSC